MASSDLLAQIQAGRSLKKAVTNDRSAPLVDGASKSSAPVGRVLGGGGPGPSASGGGGSSSIGGGDRPALGGLFANGMPKLKASASGATSKCYLK